MKHLPIIATAILAMACTAEPQFVEVSFSNGLLEEEGMTKSPRSEFIQQVISQKVPREMDLSVRSMKTSTVYNAHIGTTILLPLGGYEVTGTADGGRLEKMLDRAFFSDVPRIDVKEKISVVPERNSYPLSVTFGCVGLVIDINEVEEVICNAPIHKNLIVPFGVYDNYGIVFINGDFGQDSVELIIKPKNLDNSEVRTLRVSGIPQSGCIALEKGKYYIIHPTEVEKVESGFMLNVPAMGEIDIK